MLVAEDVRALGMGEVAPFRETLCREERIALDLHGIEPAKALGAVYDSTTYRVGRTLLAVPTAIKDRINAKS
jgi:hypothetical protein